jgi:flagellar motor component MotA
VGELILPLPKEKEVKKMLEMFIKLIATICENIGNSFAMVAETCPAMLIISTIIIALVLVGVWCAIKDNNN